MKPMMQAKPCGCVLDSTGNLVQRCAGHPHLAVFQRAIRENEIIEPTESPGISEGALRWAFFAGGVLVASAVWMWV